ncbi:MAG: hypothetical protein L6416_07525 [Candidatus Omnitrophica bacterium]|nr:hypothetical protein [Candidatus Omnitrophota bacterium]
MLSKDNNIECDLAEQPILISLKSSGMMYNITKMEKEMGEVPEKNFCSLLSRMLCALKTPVTGDKSHCRRRFS